MYQTKDVVERTNIPSQAVRKYSAVLEQQNYTFTKQSGQRYYFNKDIYLLKQIHTNFMESELPLEEIVKQTLSQPLTPVKTEESTTIISQPDKFEKFMDVIHNLSKQNEEIITINKQLIDDKKEIEEQLQHLHAKIDKQEQSRDIQLVTVIREMQEAKRLVAAAKQQDSFLSKVKLKFGL